MFHLVCWRQMMQRTYGTRLPGDPDGDALLGVYAELYGRAERTLFAKLRAGESLTALKRTFLARFGLTARQFNALAAVLRGKIASIHARRPELIDSLDRRIARAKKVLKKIPRSTDTYHQKRRRLGILEQRLRALQADVKSGRVRVCFGSRQVFRQQFALDASGYTLHNDWLRAWAAPRARGRPGPRARSSPAPIPGSRRGTARRVIRSSAAGGIPARESSAALFG